METAKELQEKLAISTRSEENDAHWQDVRERAAIAAMQGAISNQEIILALANNTIINNIATFATRLADALVEELKKK